MPGKVNPVMCESVIQVACRVIGNDATVTMAGMGGIGSIFELNVDSYRRRSAVENKRGRGRPATRATSKNTPSNATQRDPEKEKPM